MARNKRNQKVSLTKVQKKGSVSKEKHINEIRDCAQKYRHVFVFSVENMRNIKFKELRTEFEGSRIMMAKRSIMALALGADEESECREGVSHIAKALKGGYGLLFTDEDPEMVLDRLSNFEEPNFARTGFIATHDFVLPEGILEDQPFSIEPQLRKLGLPTRLDNGRVYLSHETVVCREGSKLEPNQCKILELFGVEMSVMTINVHAHLDMEEGTFSEYQAGDVGDDEDEDEEEMGEASD